MLQGNIHLNINPVRRNKGQCLVARVAYATGSSIYDPRTGETHNYRWKKSEIGMTMLITRQNETSDHGRYAAFWGAVEKHHKRKDAVPGRTMSIALPCELSMKVQKQLMLQYGRWLCATYGVGVQISAHKLGSHNPHFHAALTACEVFEDGSFGKKVTSLDPICAQHNKEALAPAENLRATWADMVNAAYTKAGVVETVDHRSYLRRSVDKIPQRHEGIWQHLACPMDCPISYNETIQTISEVLHDHGQSIYGFGGKNYGFGENALERVERNTDRATQHFTSPERTDDEGKYTLAGSPLSDGDAGRSDIKFGRNNFLGNAQSQGGHGHIAENQQAVELAEYASGNCGGESLSPQESLIDIVTAPLARAVESLELELLKFKKKVLRIEELAVPIMPVAHESLLDVVAWPLARAVESLELDTLRINKQVIDTQLKSMPVVNFENQGIIHIVQSQLTKVVTDLSLNICSFEENMHSLYERLAREVGKNMDTMHSLPASPLSSEIRKETSWDENLWQHIVMRAKQIPVEGGLANAVFLACVQMWSEYPQLTLISLPIP